MSAPCIKCGEQTDHIVELAGAVSAERFMCDGCFDAALEGFRDVQRQFSELIEAGVSNAEANRIMIARIDGAQAS